MHAPSRGLVYCFHYCLHRPESVSTRLFLEINTLGDYRNRSSHDRADSQMRVQFYDLVDTVQLPVLHSLSALGSRLCLYSYNYANATLSPRRIPLDPDQMNDVALVGWWSVDLLSEEGVAMLTKVVNEVKAMVVQRRW